MPPHGHGRISMGTWVEMASNVPMRYEVSNIDENATLYFGPDDDYVLVLGREILEQVVSLAGRAIAELNAARPRES